MVPFNQEPALHVARFLVAARSQGAAIDAAGAAQLMEAACARRTCLVPLEANDFSVQVEGVGTFTVSVHQLQRESDSMPRLAPTPKCPVCLFFLDSPFARPSSFISGAFRVGALGVASTVRGPGKRSHATHR